MVGVYIKTLATANFLLIVLSVCTIKNWKTVVVATTKTPSLLVAITS